MLTGRLAAIRRQDLELGAQHLGDNVDIRRDTRHEGLAPRILHETGDRGLVVELIDGDLEPLDVSL